MGKIFTTSEAHGFPHVERRVSPAASYTKDIIWRILKKVKVSRIYVTICYTAIVIIYIHALFYRNLKINKFFSFFLSKIAGEKRRNAILGDEAGERGYYLFAGC